MFYYIDGIVEELSADCVYISCGGVCFELFSTKNTICSLSEGERERLYIVESIGENNFDLYGFKTKNEKYFFKLLTSVSGIGPKAAVSILSYNSPESLTLAIINGDEKALTAAPGIGKKIAQRVILELKDKVAKSAESIDFRTSVGGQVALNVKSEAVDSAVSALNVLGYNTADVSRIIGSMNTEGLTADQIIKAVLKFMV